MRELSVIGIGAGNPEHLTLQAVSAIGRADVFFVVDKGAASGELVSLRHQMIQRHRTGGYRIVEIADPPRDRAPRDYQKAVLDWHAARAGRYEAAFAELDRTEVGAFLVWGDPALYDSTIRIIENVLARGTLSFELSVVPGITSVSALAAAHRTVLHGIGRPVHVTTGRELRRGWPGRPGEIDDVVVMLDGDFACGTVDPTGVTICWGANLGTPGEVVVAGPLADVLPDIRSARDRVKSERGWVMDLYLLHRDR